MDFALTNGKAVHYEKVMYAVLAIGDGDLVVLELHFNWIT